MTLVKEMTHTMICDNNVIDNDIEKKEMTRQ